MKKTNLIVLFGAFLFGIVTAAMAQDSEKIIIFDQGHGQRFLTDSDAPLGLSRLKAIFLEGGATIRISQEGLLGQNLHNVKGLIISGPFAPVTHPEIEAIKDFIKGGGKLSVMLHVGLPAADLLQALGVVVTRHPLFEKIDILATNPLDFKVTAFEKHALTNGLHSFTVYGCWGLTNTKEEVAIIARTSRAAWLDVNSDGQYSAGEPAGPFGIIAAGSYGKGEFVIIGDDAIFQNQFLDSNNERLARNLAEWFMGFEAK